MKRKVVIQGANSFGKYIKMLIDNIYEIIAFIDRDTSISSERCFDSVSIYTDTSCLEKLEYDFVFITATDITGIQREYNRVCNVPYEKMISVRHVHQYGKFQTFAAYANELSRNGITGSVAELGVDFGDSAKYINLLFPDSTLYLFDTFSGFNKDDIEFERSKMTMKKSRETSYDIRSNEKDVVNRMFYKEKCIVKQGYFPESLDGLEDTYCFVHIDCDLQKPIIAGLEYFYPRLVGGGVILVHDYFNPDFPGVRYAVREFCARNNMKLTPDLLFGGIVICK